ncbi:MAG: polyprenyl synthetase family protein [Bacteroidaceae bacterium]|nr:polyprenyl synthetase family protein [Bacteroidaceae bacterium]
MFSPQQLLQKVNAHLDSLGYLHKPENLYQPVRYVLSMGGKRLRPVLMLMAYNLYRTDVDVILDPACAIEMYHNFTLLHDDLMDRADMRRGKPTVHRRWNDNTAILSGDAMLSLAMNYMTHVDDNRLRPVMDTFIRATIDIDDGQQLDMDFEQRDDVTQAEYIEMIRLKTSVLLGCSMKIGALLAGASDDDADNLYKTGEQMGLAFQLHDDYLDVYGDPATFGKKVGGDILCNKKTFLYVKSMQIADDLQRRNLQHWFATSDPDPLFSETKIAAVTRIYTDLGLPAICRTHEDEFYRLAHAHLNKVSASDETKSVLCAYLASLMERIV